MNLKKIYQQQKNFLTGVFLVVLLVLALLFSYQNKKQEAPLNHLIVYAIYNKADGLSVGSEVRLAGINVGRISDIQLDEFYRVKVTFSLDANLQLPTDSAAMIETDGLIGSKYIELLPGGELDIMQNGDYFLYTQDVLLLDELLERFLTIMRTKKGIIETDLIEGEK